MAWLVSAAPPERRGELIGSALAAAIVGVLLGPVLGGAATVIGPEVVFSAVAVLAAFLAVWAWSTPGVAPQPGAGLGQLGAALRRPAVLAGFWLFTLPAIFAGVVEVLGPLRLDDFGASGAAIGAVFLLTAAVEAVLSPLAGRLSDRRGRLTPIRAGLVAAAVTAVLLPLPGNAVLLGWRSCSPSPRWAGSGHRPWRCCPTPRRTPGLDQAIAFSISNLAWAVGHVVGAGAGGGLADLTSDTVPYTLLAVVCAATFAVVTALSRRAPASSAVAR